jgi:hypothetical protein
MSVPDIEQRLVGKGLPSSTAAAVVTAVLEGRLRTSQEASGASERAVTAHRAASAVAVCICLALAYAFGGGPSVGRTALSLLLPVACIWWAEVLTANSPPTLVRWVAWVVLLLIAGYRVLLLLLSR